MLHTQRMRLTQQTSFGFSTSHIKGHTYSYYTAPMAGIQHPSVYFAITHIPTFQNGYVRLSDTHVRVYSILSALTCHCGRSVDWKTLSFPPRIAEISLHTSVHTYLSHTYLHSYYLFFQYFRKTAPIKLWNLP